MASSGWRRRLPEMLTRPSRRSWVKELPVASPMARTTSARGASLNSRVSPLVEAIECWKFRARIAPRLDTVGGPSPA